MNDMDEKRSSNGHDGVLGKNAGKAIWIHNTCNYLISLVLLSTCCGYINLKKPLSLNDMDEKHSSNGHDGVSGKNTGMALWMHNICNDLISFSPVNYLLWLYLSKEAPEHEWYGWEMLQ